MVTPLITTALSDQTPILTPENYINRELSWIEFNRRVLAQAKDETVPLLERLKFLAIVSSNNDEFFMVRVASVYSKVKRGSGPIRPDGISNIDLLDQIRARVNDVMGEQRHLVTEILGQLREFGIAIRSLEEVTDDQRAALRAYFYDEVFPVLTPLAVDHARPFPFISNLSLNLAVLLERNDEDEVEFVRLKIPPTVPRLVNLNDVLRKYSSDGDARARGLRLEGDVFVWIEDLLAHNLDLLFTGMRVLQSAPFRITRNADIDYEQENDDFLDHATSISDIIEETLRDRRFGTVVRLTVPKETSEHITKPLVQQFGIDGERDLYKVEGALGGASLFQLADVERPQIKYPPRIPRMPPTLDDGESIFNLIARRDLLMHHPYDSFAPVEMFFQQAARDPDVLAIKATLYRVGRNSPIVQALMEARDNDKQVAVLVELKARFDEENNLGWARQLEENGVHVTYGVEELPVKTHAKVAMVVRREGDSVRRYVHLATGNYNSSTARMYTDIGLLTANREIADDATRLFNRLTGFAPGTTYNRLLVAPEFLLSSLVDLIDNEIAAARAGGEAHIILKMNQLEEDVIIRKLYEASQAGVKIDLIVRGICCLRPGIPGMSEHIRVVSIVGRYLEHSRMFYFASAPPDRRMYLGSADIMRRNLYNRVEVVFPLLDERTQRQALRLLHTSLLDNTRAWVMNTDATYTRLEPGPGEDAIDSQAVFMEESFGLNIGEAGLGAQQ